MRQGLLGAEGGEELVLGVDFHSEAAGVERGGRLTELGHAPIAGVAVVPRVGYLALHLFDDVPGSRQIGIAYAQADDVYPCIAFLRDLALDLRKEIRGKLVHTG